MINERAVNPIDKLNWIPLIDGKKIAKTKLNSGINPTIVNAMNVARAVLLGFF